MRLIYFGTGTFALPTLQALAPHVVLVVTQPDGQTGRGLQTAPTPAKLLGQSLELPVASPEKSRAPEFVDILRSMEADALVVASYGQILSTAVLESARCGGINLHGSILPQYRGAAPIQRAILNGEKESGITLMQMARGMDTGDIIAVERLPIGPDETYGELQDRLADVAANMAQFWLPKIVSGEYPRTPQNNSLMTLAAKVDKSEAELQFNRFADSEYLRFRAFTPSPGAFVRTIFGRLKLNSVQMSELNGLAGTVLDLNPLTVAFNQGGLQFLEVQPEGKKRMSGREFANGARLKVGMPLIEIE